MSEPPPIRLFTAPVLMICVIGATIGALVGWGSNPTDRYKIFYFVAAGLAGGLFAGIAVAWNLLPRLLPERFSEYRNDTLSFAPQETQGAEILVSIPELGVTHRIKSSLDPEQWSALAEKVLETGKFGRETCILAFGPTDGPLIYKQIHRKLFDAGVLVEYGNGYKVTEHIGGHFWRQLAKGDDSVLKMVPRERISPPRLPTGSDVS